MGDAIETAKAIAKAKLVEAVKIGVTILGAGLVAMVPQLVGCATGSVPGLAGVQAGVDEPSVTAPPAHPSDVALLMELLRDLREVVDNTAHLRELIDLKNDELDELRAGATADDTRIEELERSVGELTTRAESAELAYASLMKRIEDIQQVGADPPEGDPE